MLFFRLFLHHYLKSEEYKEKNRENESGIELLNV